MITPAQCRAARALVNWSQQHLAEAATVGNATVRNFESGNSVPQHSTLDALRLALEAAGVGVRVVSRGSNRPPGCALLFIRSLSTLTLGEGRARKPENEKSRAG